MDENQAIAIIIANTKRKKRALDLISVAEACQYLTNLYGSYSKVGERIGLSSEIIRQFTKLLSLPDEVKSLVKNRRIDKFDIAYRITKIKGIDNQIAAAQALARSSTKDVRDIVRLMKSGQLSMGEAISEVDKAKPKGLHLFILDLDDAAYSGLQAAAKASGVSPAELAKEIIETWLNRQRNARRT